VALHGDVCQARSETGGNVLQSIFLHVPEGKAAETVITVVTPACTASVEASACITSSQLLCLHPDNASHAELCREQNSTFAHYTHTSAVCCRGGDCGRPHAHLH
jgi:hypothetical protein